MKQFITFVKKEFYHVLRDKTTLLILFGLPVIQMLIFGFALTNEVKNTEIVILDQSKDIASQQITEKINASQYFKMTSIAADISTVEEELKRGKTKVALIFPEKLNNTLMHEGKAQIQIVVDGSDPNYATTLTNYLSTIIMDYQKQINYGQQLHFNIVPQTKMIYNPQQLSVHNFVPGVMALILMLVCVMMTAVSIVREKENGTMEILLVSPFNPLLIIITKAIPYLILSLVNLTNILLLSVYVLNLPIVGSVPLLYAVSSLFIITCLSLGMFISVNTNSQQEAMLISLMGMLLPTIMFSGFMFPIENMPLGLQYFSNIVPAKWYFIMIKSIMIKGLGISSVWKELTILTGMISVLLILTVKRFKIRLA